MAIVKENLIAEIDTAFGHSAPPELLVEGHADWWNNRETHKYAEQVDVIRLFMGRPWWEVNSTYAYEEEAAGDLEMAYGYLLPEAFVYYLPALLFLAIGPLETPLEQKAWTWVEQLENKLDIGLVGKERFMKRFVLFTSAQKTAIAHTFRYIIQVNDETAVKPEVMAYWAQFE